MGGRTPRIVNFRNYAEEFEMTQSSERHSLYHYDYEIVLLRSLLKVCSTVRTATGFYKVLMYYGQWSTRTYLWIFCVRRLKIEMT
jgi:hypothetical protein